MRGFVAGRTIIFSTLLGLSFAVSSQAQVVTNGSFEAVQIGSPFFANNAADWPGWTHTGGGDGPLWAVGYVDPVGSITVAGDGRQFVTLGGGTAVAFASWEQTVNGFTPGDTYRLDFMMASELIQVGQSLTVDFPSGSSTGPAVFSAAPSPANYWRDWESKTMDFVATSSSVDLRFSTTTLFDVGLDNVRVSSVVPEPASLGLLLTGLLVPGAAFFYRRRKTSR